MQSYEANDADANQQTRMEPVYSHKSLTIDDVFRDLDNEICLGQAIENAERFKTPIRTMRAYGGMYRVRGGKSKCSAVLCAVCPVCVYNVPCLAEDSCLWQIWCLFGIPLPISFCTLFSCEMIGPSVVQRGKAQSLACQYVKLDEHARGFGCFSAQGCEGFTSARNGLSAETPMSLKAEPCC
jgi:hypothetical protein